MRTSAKHLDKEPLNLCIDRYYHYLLLHLCVEAFIIRNRHPVEEQTLFPLSWPLLDCVCHVPDHDDVTMIIMVITDILLLDFVSIVDCTHPFISDQC